MDSLRGLGICDENGFCNPNLPGVPRSKGFELTKQHVLDYRIQTAINDSSQTTSSEVNGDDRISLKLKFPLLLKDNFQLGMGVSYTTENFRFDDIENINNEFYENLENKSLRRLSSSIYGIRPFKGNRYMAGRFNVSLNGDFNDGFGKTTDYLRFSVALLYGIRSNMFKVEGIGLAYNYNFGRLAIYPFYAYNRQFSNKHGVELLLPVQAKYRYSPNDKNYFLFTMQLEGSNYNINLPSFPESSLFLAKSDLSSMITYEKEIHDFFWVSGSIGYRKNLNFDLDRQIEFVNRSKEPFIDNTVNDALFFRISVFLVPPRSWMEKFGK